MKVVVLVGGSGSERDVSLASGKCACEALEQAGHTVTVLEASNDLAANLRAERPDVCVVDIPGKQGEEGTVQGLLEFMGIPHVGSSADVCRTVADKSLLPAHMQSCCEFSGEQTVAAWPQGFCFSKAAFDQLGAMAVMDLCADRIPGGYPLAVKPACGGLAYGVHKVSAKEELADALRDAFTFDNQVMVQQWVEGVELSVSVLGSGWDAYALPPVEIVPRTGLYLTNARFDANAVECFAPVRMDSLSQDQATAQAIRAEIERAALEVYRAFGMEGYGRVDLIWDGAQAQVLEVDVAPSFAEHSLFSEACNAAGLSVPAVLDRLVEG